MDSLLTAAERAALRSVGDAIRWIGSRFAAEELHFGHGTQSPFDEARALVFHCLRLPFDVPDYFYVATLTGLEQETIFALADKRVRERLPLPYLTGEAWFAGLRLQVDERVLIPRSPIAELIENGFAPWLEQRGALRVLDLCTGSGALAIACAAWLDTARVVASDIDSGALEVARENVALHGLEGAVEVVQSDLFAALTPERFDLIVSNPPYVPAASFEDLPPEFAHEPRLALEAGVDGLSIVRRLLAEAPRWLAGDGLLVLEVGEAAPEFEAAFPELEYIWAEFARGGDGVAIIEARALHTSGVADVG